MKNIVLTLCALVGALYATPAEACTESVHPVLGVQLHCKGWTCTAWDQANWAGGWTCGDASSTWSTSCPNCDTGEPAPEGPQELLDLLARTVECEAEAAGGWACVDASGASWTSEDDHDPTDLDPVLDLLAGDPDDEVVGKYCTVAFHGTYCDVTCPGLGSCACGLKYCNCLTVTGTTAKIESGICG